MNLTREQIEAALSYDKETGAFSELPDAAKAYAAGASAVFGEFARAA